MKHNRGLWPAMRALLARKPLVFSFWYQVATGYYSELRRLVKNFALEIDVESANAKRPIFLDLGTNSGQVMKLFRRRLPLFQFLGFEPNPVLLEIAREQNRGVLIHHFAVSNRDGTAILRVPTDWGINPFGAGSTVFNFPNRANVDIRVPTISFLNCLQWLSTSCFDYVVVKMDVEGAEREILASIFEARDNFQEPPIDLLLLEVHETAFGPEELEALPDWLGVVARKTIMWP